MLGWGRGEQQTRQTQDKLPTSKIYTTWAHILNDCSVFCTLLMRGEAKTAVCNAAGVLVNRINYSYLEVWLLVSILSVESPMYLTLIKCDFLWAKISLPLTTCLTLQFPRVTNIKFLLTISIQNQKNRLWEWIKWSPKGNWFDLLKNYPK